MSSDAFLLRFTAMISATRIWLVLTALLMTSCIHTRYQEPTANQGETATLEANAPVWIHAIDGQKIRALGSGRRTYLRISPGPHIVQVSYDDYDLSKFSRPRRRVRSLSYLDVKFVARPDHNYVVGTLADDKWAAGITEFASAEVK